MSRRVFSPGKGGRVGRLEGTPVDVGPNRINSVKPLRQPTAENRGRPVRHVEQERA